MKHLNEEIIFEYFDNELSDDGKRIIDEHVTECEECRKLFNSVKSFCDKFNHISPDEKTLQIEKGKIYNRIYDECINDDKKSFFKKSITLSMASATSIAAAFTMIMIGAIVIYKPSNKNLTEILPGANPNVSERNIIQVSREKNLSLEEHIRAIENMGFNVILEPKR